MAAPEFHGISGFWASGVDRKKRNMGFYNGRFVALRSQEAAAYCSHNSRPFGSLGGYIGWGRRRVCGTYGYGYATIPHVFKRTF